ncbi:MAG: hypothetical protein CL402_06555 [Acidiferrobacteraceae bacterium]|nr:hypothetical protein [Acidiferrobacteraceae bacterium]
MKKLINSVESIVDEMLLGYVAAHGDRIALASNTRIVVRKEQKLATKVALIIGNGSGHEPIAMGWIGEGLLDGNIVGEIFAAPAPELILEGIKTVNNEAGVLLLVSSHSGDIINADVAVEEALNLGINVKSLLMYDDVSSAPKGEEHERRGAPGTTFIYKILGAGAEQGQDIHALFDLGVRVRDSIRTLGVAVAPGTSPLTGSPMFELEENEIFIGMGVHGEPGLGRRKMGPVQEIVSEVMEIIMDDLPFAAGDNVIAMINGSGGTTLMELLIIYKEVSSFLAKKNITIFKPLVGEMVTTQEMAGFSISLLKTDEEIRKLWAAPSSAPYFHL